MSNTQKNRFRRKQWEKIIKVQVSAVEYREYEETLKCLLWKHYSDSAI